MSKINIPSSAQKNVLETPIPKGRSEVSEGAFGLLFSEIVQYCYKNASNTSALQQNLSNMGYSIGGRLLELLYFREGGGKRETELLKILKFISSTVWKALFGKQPDSLEKLVGVEEYTINEESLLLNKFISIPIDMNYLNCGAFVAGIVQAILDGAGFNSRVSAYTPTPKYERDKQFPHTMLRIKFDPEVIARDKKINFKNYS